MTILRRIDRMLERFLGIMDGIASVSIFVIMILGCAFSHKHN